MLSKLDPDSGIPHLKAIRPDLGSGVELDKELEIEMFNAVLFASSAVVNTLAAFIQGPSRLHYVRAAGTMRRDLWKDSGGIDIGALNNQLGGPGTAQHSA